ncbi:hypothetical protein A3A50_04490 [Candidatus Woesebacteria bacterium RIFCSPLOWO2_01_FULL_38_20]|nr:MAG: hypothetical protein A3A50_04490 [Candidatus Woesebacteria bacterium RIFCSPLOWO2_01_FULL_38_20]
MGKLFCKLSILLLAFFFLVPRVQAQSTNVIINTGNIYYFGQEIPIPVSTTASTVNYTLGFSFDDKSGDPAEIYSGTGRVNDVSGVGRVAFLPTNMLSRKGVYFLTVSGQGISNRRILLVDPLPAIQNPETWPFGLITSSDKIGQGSAMADEMYRIGIKFFHFDYSISTINSIGASTNPNAGQISAGFDSFITRASVLGINPVFKLMSNYSNISGPANLNGDFYNGLRKIQTYYKGKQKYWTISNEAEGGGYSKFSAQELADTIKNMSIVLKEVDPNVKIIAGEFYSTQYVSTLASAPYRDYWDILSGHNVVRMAGNGNAGVSEYKSALGSIVKPVWDTEANGTMFGYPGEMGDQMNSNFPIDKPPSGDSASSTWGGIGKHLLRARCLETLDGTTWRPAFYKPTAACLGVDGYIAMHYNASWEQMWGVKTLRTSPADYPNTINQKMTAWRTAVDTTYGSQGVTRIPNMSCANPYACSSTSVYDREDGYIYKYGSEYVLALWQNSGDGANDSELLLQTNPTDKILLYDSLGRLVPLKNNNGQVKVWVAMDVQYVRGFTQIPIISRESSGTDAPYFVTQPVTQAVVGKPYYYQAWAYDSDKPSNNTDDSIPRLTYSMTQSPPGMQNTTSDNHALLLSWTPTTAGNYNVTIRATSNHGTSATVDQTFIVNVAPANTNLAPLMYSQLVTTFARVGYVWWYNAKAYDPNGDVITYSLPQKPSGMIIDPNTGFIQWTPDQSGNFGITLAATDTSGVQSLQTLTLTANTNDGQPIVTPTGIGKTGDANADSKVDGLDYVIWLNNYGNQVGGINKGDFNTDNRVDGLDYVIWLNNYGT